MTRAVLVSVLVSACAPPGPAIVTHSAVLPLAGPCPLDGSAGLQFTAEATSLRLTVAGDGIVAPIANDGDVGELSVDGVPVGADRVVGVFGLVGLAPLWRGVVRGVTVDRDIPAAIDVLMTRVGDVTCSRGTDIDRRAFHTATVLDDGSILVIGGAKTSTAQTAICADCRRLEGTTSASIYDPRTGTFTATGPLAFPRVFHTATKLSDGRVVVSGGARGALVDTSGVHPFPILPSEAVNTVEVFDADSKTFANVAVDPVAARVFAAATRTLDDEVIITGGIPFNLPRNDLSNALASTTICGGAALSCRAGPPMLSRRAGHVAFTLEPDGVFVMGGSIESGSGQFQVEALRPGAPVAPMSGGFEYLQVQSMSPERNFFFAATTQYLPFRLLSAGGLIKSADGTFELARTAAGGGPVVVLDMSIGAFGGIVTGEPPNPEAMGTQSPRFFGAAAALPGGTRAIIAGGFSDLAFAPSAELEKYDQATLLVEPLVVQAQPRVLHQARGGLVAAANGDGAVVFFGGETPDVTGRVPLQTAEIFADPLTPPGVAE